MPRQARRQSLIFGWIAFFVAVTAVACQVTLADQAIDLRGRITERATGQPIAGIDVGVSRAVTLQGKGRRRQVKPERRTKTGSDGTFAFAIPGDAPGLDSVALFTFGRDRVNVVYPNVPIGTAAPRIRDLQTDAVVWLDLRRDVGEIELRLPAPPTVMRDVMVAMRDGTRLATDVYLPAGERKTLPVLLYRTPYNKLGGGIPISHLDNGYAVVRQDFRGRFASEGENDVPFLPDAWGEQQDGYDTIQWVAAQPWCNGKIATVGASAGGITQVMTAGSAPPHLACQVISVACGSLYHHAAYTGGAFRKGDVESWLRSNRFDPECLKIFLDHPHYDDYWRAVDASTRSRQINVPGLFMGGWYDVFCQGTIDAFVWRQYEGGPGARGRQKLIMGPWVHGRGDQLGQFTLPEHARKAPGGKEDGGWLEHWLKGIDNGVMKSAAVTYYVMGAFDEPGAPGHEWRHSERWPIPFTATPLYLHYDGGLRFTKPSGNSQPRSYEYNPAKPVPTIGGCNLTFSSGPRDQRTLEDRADVLLYTTAPLDAPLEVTGRIEAILYASSSCRDTDFSVKLTDVYPDGKSVLIQDGIIRARYRHSFEREELLTPGDIYEFKVDLWSTSLIFNRGHRIRVAISSSNAPRFEPNPNTGDPFRANNRKVVATNTLYHDARHPSHILLPVVTSSYRAPE